MHKSTIALALVLAAAVTALFLPPVTGQDDDDEASPEAVEAQKKAVETGKALFHDEGLGTKARACANCHEDPKKPNLHLADRVGDYPKWDRREKRVITIGTKINQMIDRMLKGEHLELGGDRIVAIEAYLMSLSRDR
jgi:cytochrome c